MEFCCCRLPGNDPVHQTLSFFIKWKSNTVHNWGVLFLRKGSLHSRLFAPVMGKLLLQWKTLGSLCSQLKRVAASLWRDSDSMHSFQSCCVSSAATETLSEGQGVPRGIVTEKQVQNSCVKRSKTFQYSTKHQPNFTSRQRHKHGTCKLWP